MEDSRKEDGAKKGSMLFLLNRIGEKGSTLVLNKQTSSVLLKITWKGNLKMKQSVLFLIILEERGSKHDGIKDNRLLDFQT